MDNIRDMRFFNFDNRFPDTGTNEEIMTYLRELRGLLNMWQERLIATTDALTVKTDLLGERATTHSNWLNNLEARVKALEERPQEESDG